MRNKLNDLNNHLFEQMERLNDEELTDEQLAKEIARTKIMTNLANAIINNAKTVLDAQKHIDEFGKNATTLNPIFMIENKEKK